MRSLIFGFIILTSLNSFAIFGLGKSKEEKQCIKDLSAGIYIVEKSAKNICKNNPAPVVIQCIIYFGKRANVQPESGFNMCLDGLQYQSNNFQNYQTCIIAMIGKGKSANDARNKCIYDVNAYLIPDAPTQAPQPQPAWPTQPQPNWSTQQPQQAWPTDPQPTWQPEPQPAWQTTPAPSQNSGSTKMSKVPDYLKTEPSLDPSGNYIPAMPGEEIVTPDAQVPEYETPPVTDDTQNGQNYIPLDIY